MNLSFTGNGVSVIGGYGKSSKKHRRTVVIGGGHGGYGGHGYGGHGGYGGYGKHIMSNNLVANNELHEVSTLDIEEATQIMACGWELL